MDINNAAEMIADLKLRQSDHGDSNYILIPPNPPILVNKGLLTNGGFQGGLDQREDPNDSDCSESDLNPSLDMISNNDISLDPITNDEIASVSIITDDQSKSYERGPVDPLKQNSNQNYEKIIEYNSFPSIEPKEPSISEISVMPEKNIVSKFNILGQEAIIQAKANENLIKFAATLPPPRERAKMLGEGVRCNNTDTWARYVYRTAFKIPNNKTLGSEFYIFKDKVNSIQKKSIQCVQQISQPSLLADRAEVEAKMKQYSQIIQTDYINDNSYSRAVNILDWLRSNKIINQDKYSICIKELSE